MSGIVGLYHTDARPLDAARLVRMSAAIAHRGRDRAGHWIDGPIGLAHRLLATTRRALDEAQPLADASGGYRLVWDGRLDNRDELVALLGDGGAPAADATDAALVLRAYHRWGTECAARLLGDFAWALWDARSRSLVCARDRMGVKPFHCAWDGTTFAFGSDMGPVRVAREAPAEPDDEMILAFLLQEFRPGDDRRTFVRGIHRLPPGHTLVVRDGTLRLHRYWAIDPAREVRYADDREYAEHFLALFREAVACRLRSDWPIGALLSGGLDSSAIVCMAERLFAERGDGSPPLEAFTLFSDLPHADEREQARAVVRHTGIKGHEVEALPPAPLDGLDASIEAAESPVVGPDHGSMGVLLDRARAADCRVLLSGEGGDQLVDEVGYLGDLLRTRRPLRFVREARAFARWYGGRARDFGLDAAMMLLPAGVKYWGKRVVRGVPPPWINRKTARAVGLRARVRTPRHAVPFPSLAQADTYLSVASPYYLLKLEVEERVIARFGMEIRYPLLDSRLVEFVLAIPWERRTRDGERKRLLRASMRSIVPEAILARRGKGDYTSAMDRGLGAACREPAPLERRSGLLDRYVDRRRAARLVERYRDGAGDLRWDVWFLITVDRWLARFMKGAGR